MENKSVFIIALVAVISTCSAAAPSLLRQKASNTNENGCSLSRVCFAIDTSGSIGNTAFKEQIGFVNSIARTVESRTKNVLYSAILFSSTARIVQKGTSSLSQFENTLNSFPRGGGGTNIAAGLRSCSNQISGGPRGQKKVIVLITDGKSSSDPVPAADAINALPDVSIVTTGVGNGINTKTLKAIAARPEFFLPTNFGKLPKAVLRVVSNVCKVVDISTAPDLPQNPTTCQRAFKTCDFRFKGTAGLPTFDIGDASDRAFTPRIVSTVPKETLGVLNTNGVIGQFILGRGRVSNITSFGIPKFTPTHFKPYTISKTGGSGIGHETFQGNQLGKARKRCVRVFFTEYQAFDANSNLVNVDNKTINRKKCVVFRTI